MKTKTWMIIIAAAAAACAAAAALIFFFRPAGTTAEIVKDGVVIRTVDLSTAAEEYSIEIGEADGDRNTVTVRPGAICVSCADCPDKICVNTGWITKDSAYPIVCLPHRLVVRIVGGDADADAEAR